MSGILFIFWCASASAQSLELATELLAEGNFASAYREAARVGVEQPDNEQAMLLEAQSLARQAVSPETRSSAILALSHLVESSRNSDVRALAAYEAARLHWANGDLPQAWFNYGIAFRAAGDHELFLRSGCALFLLRQKQADLGSDDPVLREQLATCRDLWTWELRDEVRISAGEHASRLTAKPGEWIVSFYRSQIGPAIGHRCSLSPSCSAYFLEASHQHGLLGVPLIADRLVREPGVVAAAENPVEVRGEMRFADPLSDHVKEASK